MKIRIPFEIFSENVIRLYMKAPYAVSLPIKLAAIQRLVTIVNALPMPKPKSR